MRKLSIHTSLLMLFISGCATVSTPTTTPDSQKQLSQQLGNAVLWYQQAAEMQLAYEQAYEYATMLVKNKVLRIKTSKKLAVVLDIDETVLDNSPYEAELIKNGELYQSATWKEWVSMAKAEALPGAKKFIDFAKSREMEVFYISNRSVEALVPTIENLKRLGFPDADEAHVLLKDETSDKTSRRDKVMIDHEILVFVGDNLTDYSELYADRTADMGKKIVNDNLQELLSNFVMLPNPMYGEWEKAIYGNDFGLSNEDKLKSRQKALEGY